MLFRPWMVCALGFGNNLRSWIWPWIDTIKMDLIRSKWIRMDLRPWIWQQNCAKHPWVFSARPWMFCLLLPILAYFTRFCLGFLSPTLGFSQQYMHWSWYPVFDVIPHSFFEPMSYRIGVKWCPELFFRKSPLPDFGNSSIVMTALRRNSGYFTLMR